MECLSKPLVSIIIPVYNSESYVETCILSAIDQTYLSIEVIVVNDGSTDGSFEIIEKYKKKDARVVVISKPNEGLPMARKSGIDIAKGKYIQHLDSDDVLELDAIENLINKAENADADIVISPFNFCYPDQPENNCRSHFYDFGELSGIECFREMLVGKIFWSVWSCFQKRSLFQNNCIETVPYISYGEDAILMTQLLTYASKVVSMDKVTLNYNRFTTSMSCLESMNDLKYIEFRAFPVWMENYMMKRGMYQLLEKEFALLRIRNFFLGISYRRLDFIHKDMGRIMSDLKQFSNLKHMLHRRHRKILTAYQIAYWFGDFYLMYYIKKGKL